MCSAMSFNSGDRATDEAKWFTSLSFAMDGSFATIARGWIVCLRIGNPEDSTQFNSWDIPTPLLPYVLRFAALVQAARQAVRTEQVEERFDRVVCLPA
mmetsp:Transcript_62365/g.172804  ORF Transcript_62365/g.172804 Transcript_62365/m.172804 type:complete len:98 (-) Transcript_62365:70-363(-)